MKCKGLVKRNGKKCNLSAVIGGYCITHYKIYVLKNNKESKDDDK